MLWLSFQAQTGQPWEPTKRVEIAVPDGGKLMRNADVRIGGARVGQVLSIEAVAREGNVPPHAVLDVQLEAEHGDLPVDSTAEVRLASVLGGKYVSLVPGESEEMVPEGGRLALKNAVSSVDIEDALAIFDPEGRRAMRKLLAGLGDATAGRGGALNATIGEAVGLMPPLQRVLRSLAAETTQLPRLRLRPRVGDDGALQRSRPSWPPSSGDADITFAALDDAGDAVGQSLAELPLLGRDATRALRDDRPGARRRRRDRRGAAADRRRARGVGRERRRARCASRRAWRRSSARSPSPIDQTLGAVDRFATNPSSTPGARAARHDRPRDVRDVGVRRPRRDPRDDVGGRGALPHDVALDRPAHRRRERRRRGRQLDPDDPDLPRRPRRSRAAGRRRSCTPTRTRARTPQECEAGNEGYAPGQLIGNPPGLQGAPGGGR